MHLSAEPVAGNLRTGQEPDFLNAQRHWNGRIGEVAAAKHNWQLMAFAELALVAMLTAALFYLANQSKIAPYVVQVDKLGQAVAFGPASELREPTERLYRYQLATFVYNVRSVLVDVDAQRVQIAQAFAYSRGGAKDFLTGYFRETYEATLAANETVNVQVHAVLRLSAKTWQVQWAETHTNHSIGSQREEHWQAALTTEFLQPSTSEEILVNPLGLYVSEIHWTKNNN